MKILFVANDYTQWKNGGSIVTKRNLDFLKNLNNVSVTEILLSHGSKYNIAKNILFRQAYGSNKRKFNEYLSHLKQTDLVWFDGSLYGNWIELAKKQSISTICFYHNIELMYYMARFKSKPSIMNQLLLKYVRTIERKSCEFADYHILLNDRDSHNLKRIYDADTQFLLPTTFSPISKEEYCQNLNATDPYLLFVGSNFFANADGLIWFINNVAEKINYKIIIVGSICDALKDLKLPDNIRLEGTVECLTPYYVNAIAVISPIFSGSGTKTKTIEALRYGKIIIATEEALVGVPTNRACIVCKSDIDFINEINRLSPSKDINEDALRVFDTAFSENRIKKQFSNFWETEICRK